MLKPLTNIFKEGMKKKAAADADDVASPDFIEGTNLTNNAQKEYSQNTREGHLNRNFSLQDMET